MAYRSCIDLRDIDVVIRNNIVFVRDNQILMLEYCQKKFNDQINDDTHSTTPLLSVIEYLF